MKQRRKKPHEKGLAIRAVTGPSAGSSQSEDAQRAVGGDQVEIGHAAPEQWVSLAEVVVKAQTGHLRSESFARLVHLEEIGNDLPCGLGAIVASEKCDLRQRILEN